MMRQPVPELPHSLNRNRDLLALPGRVRERVPERVPPQLLELWPKQTRPEPKAQPGNNLVTGLFSLWPKSLAHGSNGFRNMVTPGYWQHEPGNSALLLAKMLTQTAVQSIAKKHLQMPDNHESRRGNARTPLVQRKRLMLVITCGPEIRNHPWFRQHVPDRRYVHIDGHHGQMVTFVPNAPVSPLPCGKRLGLPSFYLRCPPQPMWLSGRCPYSVNRRRVGRRDTR